MKEEKRPKLIIMYADKKKLIRENPLMFLLYIPGFYRLFFPKPIMIINDENIIYNPPRAGSFAFHASLSWEEIEALYLGELTINRKGRSKVQRFLCILPKDTNQFLQPYSLMNKTILSLLMMQVGTPFVISESLIPITADELLSQIQDQFISSIQIHGIELREKYVGSLTSSHIKK